MLHFVLKLMDFVRNLMDLLLTMMDFIGACEVYDPPVSPWCSEDFYRETESQPFRSLFPVGFTQMLFTLLWTINHFISPIVRCVAWQWSVNSRATELCTPAIPQVTL